MKRWAGSWFGLFAAAALCAHAPVGLVRDATGNIYYSDTARVWRVTPGGERTVFVPDVHTHELGFDAAGNLCGEHLWYNGESLNTWGHYVWQATSAGVVTKSKPDTPGFGNDRGLVSDATGHTYWADREADGGPALRRRAPDGRITTVAQSRSFRDIRWLTCSPDGTVYLIDRSDLVRVSAAGAIKVLATGLAESDAADQRHLVQGLCADDAGNVHVAVPALRAVKRVGADGRVAVVARSSFPWAPCGVLATADDGLWILETTLANHVRLRHVHRDGRESLP